jgi:hypothetical protein
MAQEHDVSKLPMWARERLLSKNAEIERLRSELEDLRGAAAAGPEGSNTFANPYGMPQALGDSPLICFSTDGKPDEGYLVELREDGLRVNVQTSLRTRLAVFPEASNEVRIRVTPW